MDPSGEVNDRLIYCSLSVIATFQLLLLTFAAALYRTLQTKEGEGEMNRGRAENNFEERSSRGKARTPPSSPQLREVRVVRGVRRRLGTSL